MRILIAEDAPSDRMLLRFHLEKLGHQVIEVSDGEQLVSFFFSHAEEVDLLVVDLNMPHKSGVQAVNEIRAFQGSYDANWVPIIILSGSESDDDVLRCIEAGADDYLVKPIQHKVLAAKLMAMTRLDEMRQKLMAMNARLEALSTTDYLTNLPNRRAFEKNLQDEMAKAGRYGQSLCVAVFDIDHFKQVNDTYGHEGGDVVLKELSRRLVSEKRAGDQFGRIGGEEFGLCLPHTDLENALIACERYRQLLSKKPFLYDEYSIDLTVSVGLCRFTTETDQLELIKGADQALYQAKHAGRDCVVVLKKDAA
ncbi:Response regulator PleD [Marinomonas aquimarina]|uniref:diguanylate cyclase n=1 Tax=Marinomonas aquimarina TaxID=295068 RepID=A0A1A8TN50_9GAMM|nr:diguanylate cyclase [Marinomonas aquimarina]SBS35221.1 Response regulator PleD [Marinomonas aquimarina]